MKIQRSICLLLVALCIPVILFCTGYGKAKQPKVVPQPDPDQLKSICQLSVIEGYFHNVVTYEKKDAERILWFTKDKHFWLEYTGVARYGLDASQISMKLDGSQITITLPKAELMYCKIDSASLEDKNYVMDKNSAKITVEDGQEAYTKAQEQLKTQAEDYEQLYTLAQQRAKQLMEDYVKNLVSVTGADADRYTIQWVYLDQ